MTLMVPEPEPEHEGWEPGSGPSLTVHERYERLDVIEEIVYNAKVPQAKKSVMFTHLVWLYVIARPEQLPPEELENGFDWFVLGGRGAGKTRTGSETLTEWALRFKKSRWACIAPTLGDARETMFEGESGLLNVLPVAAMLGGDIERAYNSGRPSLRLANGGLIRGFGSERPGRLRGPQFHGFWADEVAEFKDSHLLPDTPGTTWANIKFSTRLPGPDGWAPRGIITGTPAPVRLLAGDTVEPGLLTGYADIIVYRMKTTDNLANLAQQYRKLVDRLSGTRIGRQELDAELLSDIEGALWKQDWIVLGDRPPLDQFVSIAVGVDPSGGAGEIGIVVVGLTADGMLWVLEDASDRMSPGEWGRKAYEMYIKWEADKIVAERNFGGDMVLDTILRHTEASEGIVDIVNASRGKRVRAEPISFLFEPTDDQPAGARARFAEPMPELTGQLTSWVPGVTKQSPDRLDAMVWAALDVTGIDYGDIWDGGSLLDVLGERSD